MRRIVFWMILALLLTGAVTLGFSVELAHAQVAETIYINSDGSVSPSSAPISSVDNVTYTLTGNISYPTYSGIIVERNNTVIDGNGYTLQGPDSSESVSGTELSSTCNVTVENANIKYFWYGVWLSGSSNNTVYGNNMAADTFGVELDSSSNNNMVYGNNVTNSNGVELDSSSNNTVCANNMTGCGVELESCSNNVVWRNDITSDIYDNGGVELRGSSNNTVSENIITNNTIGVELGASSNNTFSENTIANNYIGIDLEPVAPTHYVQIIYSWGNLIYHNNFINNTLQALGGLQNVWDNGYPSGGNYWSDYRTKYPNAAEIGSSGIWNASYVIDANNTDSYPLMNQITLSAPAAAPAPIWRSPFVIGAAVVAIVVSVGFMIFRRRKSKTEQPAFS
jgi:parallel beta-helix repeat protein